MKALRGCLVGPLRVEKDVFIGLFGALDGTERMNVASAAPNQSTEAAVQLVSGEYFDVLGVPRSSGVR